MDFRELIGKHAGKRICVIGGGDSLSSDLARVRADVYISANEHGVNARECDYIVAIDERSDNGAQLKSHGIPVISPESWADYQLTDYPDSPRRVFSGLVAAWAAWAMGASCVILVGFGCYEGERLHERHMKDARLIASAINGNVRPVSGPLLRLWPAYDEKERFGRYKRPAQLDTLAGVVGVTLVRVVKPTTIRGKEWSKGSEVSATREELKHALRHRMVVEL